ncbi:MAG: ABC transporter permease [Anaerolineales bacterium]|jgi:spermidine/putrescine transport system permease protein|uniref:ABC transporter permease n=1 Tax=Candidatus Villigracilis affinis TaxID=3140682 RepID=UPI001B46D9BC|nr:ABC transporter permease [Anaerolineales bacterium]MBK9604756.1 ABC transporter permease [Anaerolineales bacterium]MBL0345757.1 ABC transporter permease [Anaerolineales bacterium]MBP8047384.1 ABC transporter permease [Anaerolineales bacterium]
MNPFRRSPFVIAAAIFVYTFLYAPIIILILYSFNASRTNVTFEGFIPAFSDRIEMDGSLVKASPCGPFHWYCDLANNDDVAEAAGNTLTIAFTATIIATIIGTMAALALQRYNFKMKPFSQLSLYIPIVIPEIVMGIGILTLFSQFFGWANEAFSLQGDARLSLGIVTVTVSHIAFMVPFVTLVVQARLQGFDKSFEEAAMDLGANEWTTFRRVTFPMILPGVLSGALLAFTLSLDDFVITFFTNGPGSTTLPIYVYGLLRRIITPQVNALSTVWILVVFTAVLLLQILQSRDSKQHS